MSVSPTWRHAAAACWRLTRPQFLVLSVVLVAHGAGLAAWQGRWNLGLTVSTALALALLHAAVNVLNDWHDWERTGIDRNTAHTAFSGGSGLLPRGELSAATALRVGLAALGLGSALGCYLAWKAGWPVLVLGIIGVLSVLLYTPVLTKIGLGEAVTGLTLGAFPVAGAYYVIAQNFTPAVWLSSVPAACLTFNLLLINEFPDAPADKAGGRRHLVILLGRPKAARLYAALTALGYLAILGGVIANVLPVWALMGLIGAPKAITATRRLLAASPQQQDFGAAQGAHVQATLLTNLGLALCYLLAALVG